MVEPSHQNIVSHHHENSKTGLTKYIFQPVDRSIDRDDDSIPGRFACYVAINNTSNSLLITSEQHRIYHSPLWSESLPFRLLLKVPLLLCPLMLNPLREWLDRLIMCWVRFTTSASDAMSSNSPRITAPILFMVGRREGSSCHASGIMDRVIGGASLGSGSRWPCLATWIKKSFADNPLNAHSKVKSSHNKIPKEKTSADSSYGLFITTSGAM